MSVYQPLNNLYYYKSVTVYHGGDTDGKSVLLKQETANAASSGLNEGQLRDGNNNVELPFDSLVT